MIKCGIYKISNIIDNRTYIGSSKNIKGRFAEHKRLLKNEKHNNIHLLRFVNKYGIDCLIFEVIELCNVQDLIAKEQYYMDLLQPKFNICKIANKPPVYRKFTKDDIMKIIELYNSGKSLNWIAVNLLNNSSYRTSLYQIKNGKIYSEFKHLFVKRKYNQTGRKLNATSRKKISEGNKYKGKLKKDDIIDIIKRLNNNETGNSIAKLYNVNRSIIYNIKNGKTHKDLTYLIN